MTANGFRVIPHIIDLEPVGVHEVKTQRAFFAVNLNTQFIIDAGGKFRGFNTSQGAAVGAQEHQRLIVGSYRGHEAGVGMFTFLDCRVGIGHDPGEGADQVIYNVQDVTAQIVKDAAPFAFVQFPFHRFVRVYRTSVKVRGTETIDFPEEAFVHHLFCAQCAGIVSVLQGNLGDHFRGRRINGFHHGLAIGITAAQRLITVDMLPGFYRPDNLVAMQVVRRTDMNDMNIVPFQ